MSKPKHKLQHTQSYNYTVIGVLGRMAVKSRPDEVNRMDKNRTTKPMTKQRKKRFGITQKSEERDREY